MYILMIEKKKQCANQLCFVLSLFVLPWLVVRFIIALNSMRKFHMPPNHINKRPKGLFNMHLSTICHLFDESARVAIFFTDQPEKHKFGRCDLASCQVSLTLNSVQSKMSKPIRGRD